MGLHGVLADVHGNRPALEAVLRDLDGRGIASVFCLGDLVGYCADPNECVQIARERGFRAILGNHELIALGQLGFERCAPGPRKALLRTRETLDLASRRYLSGLPRSLTHDGRWVFVHGAVDDVTEYMANEERVRKNGLALEQRHPGAHGCFFGHTHVPAVYQLVGGEVARHRPEGRVALGGACVWFVNAGSVDGSRSPERGPARHARFAILDDTARTLEFHAVRYDHAAVERRAVRAGYRPGRVARVRRWLRLLGERT